MVIHIAISQSAGFFLCVLGVSILYSYHLLLENKRHNILFIKKSKNSINDKISICLLNNIAYIILG